MNTTVDTHLIYRRTPTGGIKLVILIGTGIVALLGALLYPAVRNARIAAKRMSGL